MSKKTNVQSVLDSAQSVREVNDRSDLTYSETRSIGDYANQQTGYRYAVSDKKEESKKKSLFVPLVSVTAVVALAALVLRSR